MSCCKHPSVSSTRTISVFVMGLVVGFALSALAFKVQNEQRLININEHVGATVHRYQELQNVYTIQDAAIPAIAAHKEVTSE